MAQNSTFSNATIADFLARTPVGPGAGAGAGVAAPAEAAQPQAYKLGQRAILPSGVVLEATAEGWKPIGSTPGRDRATAGMQMPYQAYNANTRDNALDAAVDIDAYGQKRLSPLIMEAVRAVNQLTSPATTTAAITGTELPPNEFSPSVAVASGLRDMGVQAARLPLDLVGADETSDALGRAVPKVPVENAPEMVVSILTQYGIPAVAAARYAHVLTRGMGLAPQLIADALAAGVADFAVADPAQGSFGNLVGGPTEIMPDDSNRTGRLKIGAEGAAATAVLNAMIQGGARGYRAYQGWRSGPGPQTPPPGAQPGAQTPPPEAELGPQPGPQSGPQPGPGGAGGAGFNPEDFRAAAEEAARAEEAAKGQQRGPFGNADEAGPQPGAQQTAQEPPPGATGQAGAEYDMGAAKATYGARTGRGGQRFQWSNKEAGLAADGTHQLDQFGFILSDKGTPIRFGSAPQAAKWVIAQQRRAGNRALYETAVHPADTGAGRGLTYTVRVTGYQADDAAAAAEAAAKARAESTQGPQAGARTDFESARQAPPRQEAQTAYERAAEASRADREARAPAQAADVPDFLRRPQPERPAQPKPAEPAAAAPRRFSDMTAAEREAARGVEPASSNLRQAAEGGWILGEPRRRTSAVRDTQMFDVRVTRPDGKATTVVIEAPRLKKLSRDEIHEMALNNVRKKNAARGVEDVGQASATKPATVADQVRERVTSGGSLNVKSIARDLGANPTDVRRALEALANGGEIVRTKTGFRRKPSSTGPAKQDFLYFAAKNGGIRDDAGHELARSRDMQQFVPGAGQLIRPNGRSLDELGEAAHEAGYFGDPKSAPRPTEAQVLDLLEEANRKRGTGKKVYAENDALEAEAKAADDAATTADEGYRERVAEAEDETRAFLAEVGEKLSDQDIEAIAREMVEKGISADDAVVSHIERMAIETEGEFIDEAVVPPKDDDIPFDVPEKEGANGSRKDGGQAAPAGDTAGRQAANEAEGAESGAASGRDSGSTFTERPKDFEGDGEQIVSKDLAEPITDKARAEFGSQGPQRAKKPQKGIDGAPLFDEGVRDTSEDMFKNAGKKKPDDTPPFSSTPFANPMFNPDVIKFAGKEIIGSLAGGVIWNYQENGTLGLSWKGMLAGFLGVTVGMRVSMGGRTLLGVDSHATQALKKVGDAIGRTTLTKPFHPRNGVSEALWDKFQATRAATNQWRAEATRIAKDFRERFTPAERALMSDIIEQSNFPGSPYTGGFQAAEQRIKTAARELADYSDNIGQQLVNIGMLDPRAYNRLKGQYLHRYYASHIKDFADMQDLWNRFAKGTGRKSSLTATWGKRRGEVREISARQWAVGDRVAQYVNPATGKVRFARPGSNTMSSAGFTQTKEWVVEGIRGDRALLWRDYSPMERRAMGEVRDAAYRFQRGVMESARDLALGKLFIDIANDPRWASATDVAGWWKVPDTNIAGTSIKKYGRLGGMWVHPEVKDAMTVVRGTLTDSDIEAVRTWSRRYVKGLALWKMGKTAYNPATHFNNISSNVTIALLDGDFQSLRLGRAIKAMRTNDPIVEEAKRAGLSMETMREFGDELQDFERELMLRGPKNGLGGTAALFNFLTNNKITQAYGLEDNMFKLARYMSGRDKGMTPAEAVKYAHQLFFDYGDVPSGIKFMRNAPLPVAGQPFITYTYKAIPAMARIIAEKPHNVAAAIAVMSAIAGYSYGTLYPDNPNGREEYESEMLQPWMQGRTALGTARSLRLPWNITDKTSGEQRATWLNTRYFTPGADLGDATNNTSFGPSFWPQMLGSSPLGGNPVIQIMYGWLANEDTFFGKEITPYPEADWDDPNVPAWQKVKNLEAYVRWTAYQVLPPSTTYSFDKIGNALVSDGTIDKDGGLADFMDWTGKDFAGRERDIWRVLAGIAGVKIDDTGPDEAAKFKIIEAVGRVKDAQAEVTRSVMNQGRADTPDRLQAMQDEITRLGAEMDRIRGLQEGAKQ